MLLPCGMGTRMSRQSAKSPTIPRVVKNCLRIGDISGQMGFLLLDMCIRTSACHHYIIVTLLTLLSFFMIWCIWYVFLFDLIASTQGPQTFHNKGLIRHCEETMIWWGWWSSLLIFHRSRLMDINSAKNPCLPFKLLTFLQPPNLVAIRICLLSTDRSRMTTDTEKTQGLRLTSSKRLQSGPLPTKYKYGSLQVYLSGWNNPEETHL